MVSGLTGASAAPVTEGVVLYLTLYTSWQKAAKAEQWACGSFSVDFISDGCVSMIGCCLVYSQTPAPRTSASAHLPWLLLWPRLGQYCLPLSVITLRDISPHIACPASAVEIPSMFPAGTAAPMLKRRPSKRCSSAFQIMANSAAILTYINTPALGISAFTATPLIPAISTQPSRMLPRLRRLLRYPTHPVPRMMSTSNSKIPKDKDPSTVTDSEWRKLLSNQEYRILRQKGTEYPGTGEYDGFYPKEGYFACRACGNPLYSAESKFKSGCGWPAFDKCYKGSVTTIADNSLGMRRVEITCANCGGHLGHVFEGERMTDTNERHCVNSVSVTYVKAEMDQEQEKVL